MTSLLHGVCISKQITTGTKPYSYRMYSYRMYQYMPYSYRTHSYRPYSYYSTVVRVY